MLMKLKTMMRKDEKGFTLVELIVVMAILAILVSLAIPRFSNVMVDSKFKAHNANVELLTRAVEMYNAQESAEFNDATLKALETKNYVKKIPDCPIAGVTSRVKDADKVAADTPYTWDVDDKVIAPNLYEFNDGDDVWEKKS
jgi:type IV pilus assembly protein PilA